MVHESFMNDVLVTEKVYRQGEASGSCLFDPNKGPKAHRETKTHM